jgi:signal transduction histidine kinase
MKKIPLFAIVFLITSLIARGQVRQAFYLNKLSKTDTLLSGWVFQGGDNSQWANPTYDDSKWEPVDPGMDITKFDKLKNAGVGWLRLHITADSAITRQQILASVSQYTASEIYLDGKLIQRYGHIDHDPAKTVAMVITPDDKPLRLNLKAGVNHVIAVRLGSQSGIFFISPLFIPLSAFSMSVNGYDQVRTNSEDSAKLNQKLLVMNAIATGIFLILALIHFFYFIFDRSQKINLYYLIYCLSILYIFFTLAFIYYQGHAESLSPYMLIFDVGTIAFCVAFLFLVLVVYVLFGYQKRTVFKILIVLAVATVLSVVADDIIGSYIDTTVFPVLCMLEVLRICILALKQKKKDAVIIVSVICIYIGLYVWEGLMDQTTILATVLMYFVYLGLPFAIAIYLSIKTASTNRVLKVTLAEVRTLSVKNLAYEHEKQEILATQNLLLEQQVAERTADLNHSLVNLKATQNQLIQSEKMASLGELTAGIAHEIQNPLNFVNNFSEVSVEMLGELKAESQKPKAQRDVGLENGLIDDLTGNLEKIRHHGKRADGIVKGMLEHSRASTGQKEVTDINKLADEYLRLAYHGFRAKDKTFNTELITRFDEKLPSINVVPQDVGRVLLNLYNNAFYAVSQKAKNAGPGYKPTIEVKTTQGNNAVQISVKDNGDGIPETIKDKIMQPFFTTKPTGEGTGLGLSLSYDIVVKGHGGKIHVDSVGGEGSEFTIHLPMGSNNLK